jgi:hypothetical protein
MGPAGKLALVAAAPPKPAAPAAAAGAWAQAKPMLVVANIANNPCLTAGENRFIELTLIQKKMLRRLPQC